MSDRAPRIDTVRNQLSATATLLDKTRGLIDVLHDLAYSRHRRPSDEPAVAGGHRDYALDNHGDPKARDAYRHLAAAVDEACGTLAIAAHETIRLVNVGDEAGRNRMHPATVTVLEHVLAIDAQHRRQQRGEFDTGRQMPQPREQLAARATAGEIARLQRELGLRDAKIAKLERRNGRLQDQLTDLRQRRARTAARQGPSTS